MEYRVSFPGTEEVVVDAPKRYTAVRLAAEKLGLREEFDMSSLAKVATVRKRGLHLRRNPIVRQLLEVTIPNV